MKPVHVISFRKLRAFAEERKEALAPLRAWYRLASRAEWKNIAEVRSTYPHADSVGNCTVFNIGRNDFRLVVQINYETRVIYVRKVMTHAEYSYKNGAQWKNACGC
jgi:mRNA interferase HigB